MISSTDRRISVPANMNCCITPLLLCSLFPIGADTWILGSTSFIKHFFRRTCKKKWYIKQATLIEGDKASLLHDFNEK